MGRKGPLTFVSLQEFKERTSLRMSSRSPLTLKLDAGRPQEFSTETPSRYLSLPAVSNLQTVAWIIGTHGLISPMPPNCVHVPVGDVPHSTL